MSTADTLRAEGRAEGLAGRVSVLRRIVPARTFDKSIRKLNRMAG